MKYGGGYDPPVGRKSRPAILARPIEPIKELLIKGIRHDGSTFRPSDWAERLCGVAALLDSDAIVPIRAHQAARPGFYCSSHVRPAIISGVICVIVDLRLRDLEKRVWDFVTGFAHDNNLIMLEYCQFAGGLV
ncbi:DUF3579 domain-containing protein [Nitrosospira multiformis]|uniref:DUF3579 domain-containing protein n=1 Tax=Nitrosospira multiformis TaxID=1231 RepID=A0A1I7HXL3_9PROT|nr:DUF3579 domain-containing protein [Nitrosospira multiformis]SFU65423.1 Protein of unknown function [Nitrosospira multiformis]